ncbi:MAG: hypothetical protein JW860_00335 [Sedimentisphaerales bacterium]|nr:hypothetical protein [Sedimentisphaerales bacterium]
MRVKSDPIRLTTPGTHGDTFIWPDLEAIKSDIHYNLTVWPEGNVEVWGEPLEQRRRRIRREILQRARHYTQKLNVPLLESRDDQALIVTGHQCQFYHCGVLFKYYLARHLARLSGGVVVNIIVDTDTAKNLSLSLPDVGSEGLELRHLSLGNFDSHIPVENQPLPSADELAGFREQLKAFFDSKPIGAGCRRLEKVLAASLHASEKLTDLFCGINHRLRLNLDLPCLELPVSVMSGTQAFTEFIADGLIRARQMHQCYNEALRVYRQKNKIRSMSRPVRDLSEGADRSIIEVPFWVMLPGGERRRLFLKRKDNTLYLLRDGSEVLAEMVLPSKDDTKAIRDIIVTTIMERKDFSIRARALTMTVFCRLFWGDFFVHGIGGAAYEQVSDEFIQRFYQIPAPAWCCGSATMWLGLGNYTPEAEIKAALRRFRHEQRDLYYNPGRTMRFDSDKEAGAMELLRRREEAIQENQRLRRSRGSSRQRREIFDLIHGLNESLADWSGPRQAALGSRIKLAQSQMDQARIAYNREYFFGLFPDDELSTLTV